MKGNMTGTTFMSKVRLTAAAGLAVAVLMLLGAGQASASQTAAPPANSNQLSSTLGELWTTVLQLPYPDNPFGAGGPCVYLPDGQLAPFGPGTCTVQRGTKLFVWSWTQECSTFVGDNCGGPSESYSQLLAGAEAFDAQFTTHTLTVDGAPVQLTEATTAPLNIILPDNNVFGPSVAGGTTGLSAGHGWVALLDALPVGTHTIVVHLDGEGLGPFGTFTTIIHVV
jgi:hypothetical protein